VTTVRDILEAVDRLAPFCLAEPWDNVGLLLGDPAAEVRRMLVALDATEAVCDEAARAAADVLLVHHPPIFQAIDRVTADTPQGRVLLRLAREGRAAIAAHTNLDAAEGGLADLLADRLGLTDTAPLVPGHASRRFKVVVYAPEKDLSAVARAGFEAGAGRVGAYTEVGFEAAGTGWFTPDEGASPAEGEVGRANRLAERRLETVVTEDRLAAVVSAMAKAHPYEEPVIDAYALHDPPAGAGLGRAGPINGSSTLADLADKTKEVLGCKSVHLAGDPAAPVVRAGVMTGSGGGMAEALQRAGCQAYVTGEMKYHDAQDLAARGIGVILGGHWRTERVPLAAWTLRLAEAVDVEVRLSAIETDPATVW